MEENKKLNNNKNLKVGILAICIVIIIICITLLFLREFKGEKKKDMKPTPTPSEVVDHTGDFTVDIIKEVNKDNASNYLISPYNIEMALNMLREGTDGTTKEEIDKAIGNRNMPDVSIKNQIGIANGIFIKEMYKNNIKNDFMNTLTSKYNSEVIYDKFVTPDKINKWVDEKTNHMIPSVLDKIDESFILGLASALAIDVKWQSPFECTGTTSEEFTKIDNSKMNVEMMHETYKYTAKYIKTEDATGIILPYRTDSNDVELEFVGILPNNSVNDFVNSLTKEKINNLFENVKVASEKLHIHLSLPRFTYDFTFDKFMDALKNIGINEVFNAERANLSRMITDVKAYVGEAIHKTKIELNEEGTNAAAITFFGVDGAMMIPKEEYEEVIVKFNKPFIYMIREKNTGEILFFGSVYEPNKWEKSTCGDDE